ncbi:MAG: Hsp70 family protein, partial [Kiritimatiellae bacterium]|nr:Hsp70 family protein [Kiritimatiellia bacterium]
MENAIGIDFGTTKTMVSFLNPVTGRAELVRLGRDRDSIPTTIHEDESGAVLFGEDADDQIVTDPEGYCRAFKLHLGESDSALPRSNETAESLAARFLHYVKEECEQSVFHGGSVESATITVPVGFAPARTASLWRAAAAAGFASVSFLPEPEAAGTAFLRDNPADSFSRALVLDWGGGTLDIAIIARSADGTIHADRHCAEGRDDVGGEEMDRGLLARMDALWQETFSVPLLSSEENEPQLLREAEKIKIGLSRKGVVSFRRGPKKIDLNREQFEQIVSGLVDTAVDLVQSALDKNKAQGGQPPDAILLIGGTSQAPVVRKTMERKFPGLRVLSWHHSHEAVALGATSLVGTTGLPVGEDKADSVDVDFQSRRNDVGPAVAPKRYENRCLVPTEIPKGVPDEFAPAWRSPDIDPSALGFVTDDHVKPYFGFGSEDDALEMEKGLLVWRKRLGRFAVVPFPEESGTVIDILSRPVLDEIDLDDYWNATDQVIVPAASQTKEESGIADGLSDEKPETDVGAEGMLNNPFSEPEREAFRELCRRHGDLSGLQSEYDWFASNSKDGYAAKRRSISAQLAQLEAERKTAEVELSRVRTEGGKGLFSGIKANFLSSGIESKIKKFGLSIKNQLDELQILDAESKRYDNWPFAAKTEELL